MCVLLFFNNIVRFHYIKFSNPGIVKSSTEKGKNKNDEHFWGHIDRKI